jgi:hypothetical protein
VYLGDSLDKYPALLVQYYGAKLSVKFILYYTDVFFRGKIYFTTRLPTRLVYRILNGAWPNLFNLLTMEEDHGFCLLMKYELALLNFTEINKAS